MVATTPKDTSRRRQLYERNSQVNGNGGGELLSTETKVDENMHKMRGASRAFGAYKRQFKTSTASICPNMSHGAKRKSGGSSICTTQVGLAVIQTEGVLDLSLRDHLLEERPNGAYKANWERSLF